MFFNEKLEGEQTQKSRRRSNRTKVIPKFHNAIMKLWNYSCSIAPSSSFLSLLSFVLTMTWISFQGHAAPILYAVWAEAGLFPVSDLAKLRTIDSDLEGHPTPVSNKLLLSYL